MSTYSINETCCCGAKFVYNQVSNEHDHRIEYEHTKFLKAHEDCRKPAIISNGLELKMFLARKPVMTANQLKESEE